MLPDPVPVVGDLGVHTRIQRLGAPVSPGHNPSQPSTDGQRASRVSLAAVLAPDSIVRSADRSSRQFAVLILVSFVAQALRYNWDLDCLERLSQAPAALMDASPAGDHGLGTRTSLLAFLEHRDGLRALVYFKGLGHLDQAEVEGHAGVVAVSVVLVSQELVYLVHDATLAHLVEADSHGEIATINAIQTMGCSEDKVGGNDGATTEV